MIWPASPATKFCKALLLLVTPVPLIISSPPEHPTQYGGMFKVKELEPGVNTMLFTSSDVETFTLVWKDAAKVATSEGPFGGPPVVQLLAFSQAESCGEDSHVALPARPI